MNVSLKQAETLIKTYLQHGIVPYIKGSPGIGKSAIVQAVAKELNLFVIDYRLAEKEPTDVSGYGHIVDGRSVYAPTGSLPLDIDEVPEGYEGFLIFLDEFSNAPPAVQNVAYKIVLDRRVGDSRLHPKAHIVAAGNKDTDGCHTESISPALISRMAVFDVDVLATEWSEWAASIDVDHRILAFIGWRDSYLYTFNPDSADPVYACPRTWMKVNSLTKGKPITTDTVYLMAPLIGEGVAREYQTFCKIFNGLPKLSAIVTNPEGTDIPKELDVRWATLTSIATHATAENVGQLLKYINRFPGELRVVCVKQMIKRTPSLLETKEVDKWFEDNAEELL